MSRLPSPPRTVSDIDPYPVAFARAVEFTRSLGLCARHLDDDRGPLFDKGHDALFTAMARLGIADVSGSARQCLRWCEFLAPRLQQELGVAVQASVGQLWVGGDPHFTPTWSQLRTLARPGLSLRRLLPRRRKPSLRVHAWMTFPSGEILDPTVYSSLSSLRLVPNGLAGHVMAGYPDEEPVLRYVPMVLGGKYLERLGRNIGRMVWASDVGDLISSRIDVSQNLLQWF